MLTKSDFLKLYEENKDLRWMMVCISIDNRTPEVILNPRVNFGKKMRYYDKMYRENLEMKNSPNVKIVNFNFSDSPWALIDTITRR